MKRLMNLIDRINSRILARMRRHQAQISVDGNDVVLASAGQRTTCRLVDLTAALVSHHPNYVGSDIVLTLGFADGTTCRMAQDHPQWFDLMAALDRSGRIAVPASAWQLAFLAAGEQAPPLDLLTLRNSG
jgi:hypothetical protein